MPNRWLGIAALLVAALGSAVLWSRPPPDLVGERANPTDRD
jgi:hypothetical protein